MPGWKAPRQPGLQRGVAAALDRNMLEFFSVVIMLVVAYAHWREGVFTAVMTCVNVLLAGLVTFNFWEPLADRLDVLFTKTILEGYEDILVMLLLFCITLMILRMVTNHVSNTQIEFQPLIQQFGAAFAGLITGYLVSGILVCMLQTLPWHENFMHFEARRSDEAALRSILPPDRVWLALAQHAGAVPFSHREIQPNADSYADRFQTFDRDGSFEMNYLRHRRYGDQRNPLPYGRR